MSREDNQDFWSTLFKESNILDKLLAGEITFPTEFDVPKYGKVSVTARPAVPLGTNFMSHAFTAIALTSSGTPFSAFVKIPPVSNPFSVTQALRSGYYHREVALYQEWLPELRKMKEDKGLKDLDLPLNVSDAYYVNLTVNEDGKNYANSTTVVLQELKSRGYGMNSLASTPAGIDLDHAKAAMQTFANYHALSIARLRQLKKVDGTYNLTPASQCFRQDPHVFHPANVYRTVILPSISKVLKHFDQIEAADWLESQIPHLDELWNWNSFVDAGPLTCVIHGDSWSNNILFRYRTDEGQHTPLDMLLVDWQVARLGHPCFDVGYFLFTGTSSEFRRKHLDSLWIEYFGVLHSALLKLGVDLAQEGYDLDRFMRETKMHYVLNLMIALLIMPFFLNAIKTNKTLKDRDIPERSTSAGKDTEGGQDAEAKEKEKTSSFSDLFDPNVITANPLLSQGIVGLIIDIKDMAQ